MTKRIFASLTILLTLLTSISGAQAATASQVYVFRNNTRLAHAMFQRTTDGVITNVSIVAGNDKSRAPQTSTKTSELSYTAIDIYQYREDCPPWQEGCTLLLHAQGFTEAPQFGVNADLSSGYTRATLTATDHVSTASFPIEIDLTWTGVGDILRNQGARHVREGGLILTTTGLDHRRIANIEGSLLMNGMDLTANASSHAELERAGGTQVMVEVSY